MSLTFISQKHFQKDVLTHLQLHIYKLDYLHIIYMYIQELFIDELILFKDHIQMSHCMSSKHK